MRSVSTDVETPSPEPPPRTLPASRRRRRGSLPSQGTDDPQATVAGVPAGPQPSARKSVLSESSSFNTVNYAQAQRLARLAAKRRGLRRLVRSLRPGRSRGHLEGTRDPPFGEMAYAEQQNCVGTLELFRYALPCERFAVFLGVALMWYAASWQPISVFILATMASLMGHYMHHTHWLDDKLGASSLIVGSSNSSSSALSDNQPMNVTATMVESQPSEKVVGAVMAGTGVIAAAPDNYANFRFLSPLYWAAEPLFSGLFSGGTHLPPSLSSHGAASSGLGDTLIQEFENESQDFLHKSFQLNGSAFLLGITQLVAFFAGMSLITWVAQRQAARIKILYFGSSLRQEVAWFESVDSAIGSGSSLNAQVERYEDGIGVKLALLCYFLGHVALFTATAFSQLLRLAAYCVPFVAFVGLLIAYLSEWQAVAIGQHALFAKRSMQLAEEILAAIRTVFAFNGQQKESTRYATSLRPVYRKSLIKHLYTALNTSLSKFSVFACCALFCFFATRLFPPHEEEEDQHIDRYNQSTVLAVIRGAEVSIVNILISIPFMEALQQSKGSIARIYAAIERQSRMDPSRKTGTSPEPGTWAPSVSFRMIQFVYTQRSGPTRRRSTLPFLNLAGSPGSGAQAPPPGVPNVADRRRSLIDDLTNDDKPDKPFGATFESSNQVPAGPGSGVQRRGSGMQRRGSAMVKRIMGSECKQANKRILNYFNLEIRAGQTVALVGPSGSGKSTVLSLVQRLYDATGGQLLIGQHNIKDLNIGWLRRQIGVVTQEPRLFDMTIAENIQLGLVEDETFDEFDKTKGGAKKSEERAKREAQIQQQVEAAAKAANAHEFIVKLPHGYATRVGSGGLQLSGGQKQRIAIARALVRQPKILLLDESTSALDTESESKVQTALKEASVGRTTIIVAHRLTTIKHVDLIVVMAEGQVIECGTHDELMALPQRKDSPNAGYGLYRQMWDNQQRAIAAHADDEAASGGRVEKVETEEHRQMSSAGDEKKPSQLSSAVFVPLEGDGAQQTAAPTNTAAQPQPDNGTTKKTTIVERTTNRTGKEGDVDDDVEEDDDYSDDSEGDVEAAKRLGGERPGFWNLWRFADMPKWSALAACIACFLSGLVLPINLIAHSYLFESFALKESAALGHDLHVFGLVMLSFSTFVFIIAFLQTLLPGYVGEKLSVRLRIKIMESLLNKPMFYFDMDANSAGALCDRFNSHIGQIQSIAGARIATLLESTATLLAGAVFGFGQSVRLSLCCLVFALIVLGMTIVESKIVQRESSRHRRFDAQLAHLMADTMANIKTIASLNQESFFLGRFSQIIKRRQQSTPIALQLTRIFLTSLKFLMPAFSWTVSMYYGCVLLTERRIDLQTIFVVCPVVLFAVNDTFRALVFLPELVKARKSLRRLWQLNREFSPEVLQTLTFAQQLEQQHILHLNQAAAATVRHSSSSDGSKASMSTGSTGRSKSVDSPAIINPKNSVLLTVAPTLSNAPIGANKNDEAQPAPNQLVNRRLSNLANLPSYMRRKSSRLNSLVPRTHARGRIEFQEVEFAYPNRPSALVLEGFSLKVAPGEWVALVGGSGSGKSTCVSILEKFYDYHGGKVTLDGRDLRLVEPNWVRSQIGLVSQEPVLLSYTIGDNIRYGDNSRFVSMEEVVEAAKTANIHDFIMSLPDQYDTELSTSAYSSSQLSGGQRQRIAIARALIRNAPILVFDEATSALDIQSETVVQDALNKARRGKTALTIAHRLATIRDCDKIVVMSEGRVVEIGSHQELLAKEEGGFYRALWERQEGAVTPPSSADNDQSTQATANPPSAAQNTGS